MIVTDDALTHCISEARQAIADSRQTLIVTVPRRGYRFTASVLRLTTNAAVPTAEPSPATPKGGARLQSSSHDRPCVAVLPFANLSGDPQQDYFSDGITEDITTELSRFSGAHRRWAQFSLPLQEQAGRSPAGRAGAGCALPARGEH